MTKQERRDRYLADLAALYQELSTATTDEERATLAYDIEIVAAYLITQHGMTPAQLPVPETKKGERTPRRIR